MILINNEARLLVGLTVREGRKKLKFDGQANPPRWLPGKNPLDSEYWDRVKSSGTMKRWLKEGMIQIDSKATAPDVHTPPSAEDLAAMSSEELRSALLDPEVPASWHPTLERELGRREDAAAEKAREAALARDPKSELFNADGGDGGGD